MKKRKDIVKDLIAAVNKANREQEIEKYGRPILMRSSIQTSKKIYKRNKKVTLSDDL